MNLKPIEALDHFIRKIKAKILKVCGVERPSNMDGRFSTCQNFKPFGSFEDFIETQQQINSHFWKTDSSGDSTRRKLDDLFISDEARRKMNSGFHKPGDWV